MRMVSKLTGKLYDVVKVGDKVPDDIFKFAQRKGQDVEMMYRVKDGKLKLDFVDIHRKDGTYSLMATTFRGQVMVCPVEDDDNCFVCWSFDLMLKRLEPEIYAECKSKLNERFVDKVIFPIVIQQSLEVFTLVPTITIGWRIDTPVDENQDEFVTFNVKHTVSGLVTNFAFRIKPTLTDKTIREVARTNLERLYTRIKKNAAGDLSAERANYLQQIVDNRLKMLGFVKKDPVSDGSIKLFTSSSSYDTLNGLMLIEVTVNRGSKLVVYNLVINKGATHDEAYKRVVDFTTDIFFKEVAIPKYMYETNWFTTFSKTQPFGTPPIGTTHTEVKK